MSSFYGDLANQVGINEESEVSDVNPTDMAKMLQDLDDMDDDLFKSTLKKRPSDKGKSLEKGTRVENIGKQEKQHVEFEITKKFDASNSKMGIKEGNKDHDWDDPLDDILSSDESLPKKSFSNKRTRDMRVNKGEGIGVNGAEKSKESKEKQIANLFGLEDNTDKLVKQKQGKSEKNEGPKSLDSYLDKNPENKSGALNENLGKQKIVQDIPEKQNAKKNERSYAGMRRKSDPTQNDDTDDLLMDLGLGSDNKKGDQNLTHTQIGPSKAKQNLDDIFSNSNKIPAEDSKQVASGKEMKKASAKVDTNQDMSVSFGSYAPSIPTNRESRRAQPKRTASAIGDPLGIFSPPLSPRVNSKQEGGTKEEKVPGLLTSTPVGKTQRTSKQENKSDWLGLVDKGDQGANLPDGMQPTHEIKVRSSSPVHAEIQVLSKGLPDWLGGVGGQRSKKETVPAPPATDPRVMSDAPPEGLGITLQSHAGAGAGQAAAEQGLTLQANLQLEAEAARALQQQEQQLVTALRLRQHEAHLADLHQRQHALLQRQEQQMQQLLGQQAERQRQLETQLNLQQQRISGYMQALLAQSPITYPVAQPELSTVKLPSLSDQTMYQKSEENKINTLKENAETEENPGGKNYSKMEFANLQVALQQCDLEKKALQTTLENLQVKHQEEVQLMEECYKRQISIIEDAMEKQDQRLKAENERLERDYKERLTKAQEQYVFVVESHAQQIATLQRDHLGDLQALKQQHSALLEHVRHIQQAETAAVRDASQNMNVLQVTMEQLDKNTGSLSELQAWLQKQQQAQKDAREAALKAKEAEIQACRDSLARQREATEEDRRKLLALVEQLEMQVSQQKCKAEEEHFSLRQDTVRFDARVQAFEKEKERTMAQLEREHQHVEKSRQLLLEEQRTVSLQLKEEKLNLARERARLESVAQLQNTAVTNQEDVMQLKAEAEAALLVAKEATDQIEKQRATLREQQRLLDNEKRKMQEIENDLTIRARDLEALSQAAVTTRNEGKDALAKALQAEELQMQRALELQKQLNEMKDREQRLAEERTNLSQERLRIHKNKGEKLCVKCQGPFQKQYIWDEDRSGTFTTSSKYVDPKAVILKLVAEKERDALLSSSQHFSATK